MIKISLLVEKKNIQSSLVESGEYRVERGLRFVNA